MAFPLHFHLQTSHLAAKIHYSVFRCFQSTMIGFHNTYYSVDDGGKTPTAFSALLQHAENHARHDQPPWILIEKISNDLLDFALRDNIAMADKHSWLARG